MLLRLPDKITCIGHAHSGILTIELPYNRVAFHTQANLFLQEIRDTFHITGKGHNYGPVVTPTAQLEQARIERVRYELELSHHGTSGYRG